MCLLRKRVCSYIIRVQWLNPENLIWLPTTSVPVLLVFPGMCFTVLHPGTGPKSGLHAHPSLVSISSTAAGSCLVSHDAYSFYGDGTVSPEGRLHWACPVFSCAQIQDMQVGQDPTHMTLWPSPASPLQVCGVHLPPSRWCQLGWGKNPLVFSTISTDWRLFSLFTEKHFETTHMPWLSPTPPTPFRIHWWLSPQPILTTIDVKLWLCSPTPSMFIASIQPWRPPPSPSLTYIFPELFICLFIISMDLQSTAVLISFDDLIIPDLAKESTYVFSTSPSFFIYIPYWKLQSTFTGFPILSSLWAFFFFNSQGETLFTSDTGFHFKAFSVEQAFWFLTWSHWSIFSFIATVNFYTLFK